MAGKPVVFTCRAYVDVITVGLLFQCATCEMGGLSIDDIEGHAGLHQEVPLLGGQRGRSVIPQTRRRGRVVWGRTTVTPGREPVMTVCDWCSAEMAANDFRAHARMHVDAGHGPPEPAS